MENQVPTNQNPVSPAPQPTVAAYNPYVAQPQQANQAPFAQKTDPKTWTKPKILKPILITLGIIFIVGLIIGLGYFVYMQMNEITPPPPKTDDEDKDDDGPLSSADWKVFENKEYGFSLKHPDLDTSCCSIPGPSSAGARSVLMLSDEDTIEFPGTDEKFDGVSVFVDSNLAALEFEAYINEEIELQKQEYKLATGTEFTTGGEVETVVAGVSDEYAGKKLSGFTVDTNERYYFQFPDKKSMLILSLSNDENPKFKDIFKLLLVTLSFTRPEVKSCGITQFELTAKVPETWTCETTVKNVGSFNEYVESIIKSDLYTITIDNPKEATEPCISSGKETQIGCFFNDFYVRTDFKLQLYQLNDERLSIYGFLKHDKEYKDIYMTIEYKDIKERGLTEEEKVPLHLFLDSIEL